MSQSIRHNPGNACTPRDGDFDRYDAAAHLRWVRESLGFRAALGEVHADGLQDRIKGRAWREYGIGPADGDAARIGRWRGRQRDLARVLPPKLRSIPHVLMLGTDPPIEIPPSRALERPRANRLRSCCARTLDPDAGPLSDADRAFMRRALHALDPVREPTLTLRLVDGDAPTFGALAAVSATDAAGGFWALHKPREGYPLLGVVASTNASAVAVRTESPRRPGRHFVIGELQQQIVGMAPSRPKR